MPAELGTAIAALGVSEVSDALVGSLRERASFLSLWESVAPETLMRTLCGPPGLGTPAKRWLAGGGCVET